MKYVLAIDQGTSGSKAIIFDTAGNMAAKATVKLSTQFFGEGFVEQNPQDIISSVQSAVSQATTEFREKGFCLNDILCCGISNQRESFLIWDKQKKPKTNVIVWQCKRSVAICESLKKENKEKEIYGKSGLPIDPYFSGTKVRWLMEHTDLYEHSKNSELFFGTIDTWLLYNLTENNAYKTDYTNASRTLFFNLDTLAWDESLKCICKAEHLRFPDIFPSSNDFGTVTFGGIFPNGLPVSSMIGDSHAASFGEGCFSKGAVKATMGTGSSVMMNTGQTRTKSKHGMVDTICWSTKDRIDYALEGVIVSCCSTITWLQEQLGIITDEKDFDQLAESVQNTQEVVFLPAFSGLGGPHWQMDRKAQITGITFSTTAAHIVRAALEAYPFQLKDVITAMEKDTGQKLSWLKADGGLTNSRLSMNLIAELLQTKVMIDKRKEASAFGASVLALIQNNVLSLSEAEKLIRESQTDMILPKDKKLQSYIGYNYKLWQEIITKGN